tara:strand:- start:574 stop:1305 length:732 start_codon:yes stop_codon:yes gene_type:complete
MNSTTLQAHDVHIKHHDITILKNIDIAISTNQIVAIMGPSGVGKSSLLNILNGQKTPDQGEVTWQETPLTQYPKPYPFGILFQNNALLLHLSVYDNVALALRYQKVDEQQIKKQVTERLEEVGLAEHSQLYPEQLSGGMARRVAIARATIAKPKMMFFDEPFSGLDPPNTLSTASLIKKVNQSLGASTVIVTHEPDTALDLADYIYLLHGDSIYTHGTPKQILQNKDPLVKQFISPNLSEEIN